MAFNLFKKNKKEPKPKTPAKTEVVATEATPVGSGSVAPKAVAGSVLKHFYVSEKAARVQTLNQYTFLVNPSATKGQIRDAVAKGYGVKVASVNVVHLPAKARRVGRFQGSSPARKKAIVTLAEGSVIATAQP